MPMTPEEELFAKFFRAEMVSIKDLDDVDLRVRREELKDIAREAKARLTAVNEEEREREAKSKKSSGFKRSVDADDIASDAINKINKRNKNLSKMDKVVEGLMKIPGMDRATAEGIAKARTVKDVQGIKASTGDTKFAESLKTKSVEVKDSAPISNPFALATPKEPDIQVSIQEEVTIITKTEEPKEPIKLGFVNPFEKK